MSAREPYRRRSARVLLLDGAGRILLLRYRLDAADPGRGHIWLTPGGASATANRWCTRRPASSARRPA